jgi:phosphate:Na+ symporter
MVLGENIGTTITANIAAAVANTSAKRAALAHTVFNMFGVIWALIAFPLFLKLTGFITSAIFAVPNPASQGFVVETITAADGTMVQSPSQTAALFGLSMLHTLFNTINTCILIWFIPGIEKIVCKVIKSTENQEKEPHRLMYINAGPIGTPELATEQAFKEIIHFATISHKGLQYAKQAMADSHPDGFELIRTKLVKYEEIADRIELEIANFLNSVSAGDISEETSVKIKAMYKIIGELESLGDSGETISRIITRKNGHKKTFDPQTINNLEKMAATVENAYMQMIENLNAAHKGTLTGISNAYQAETQINTLRNYLRDTEIEGIENGSKNYQSSIYYMDLVSELEKMGDFIINISQDLEKAFVKK